MSQEPDVPDITGMALAMARATERFIERAREFFYEVMLADHTCPACGGRLHMIGESRCRCDACGQALDPTQAFQRCGLCGGQPILRVCRHQCRGCGQDVPSHFVFDGIAFDAEYFRLKMAESRERRTIRRAEAARRATGSRSADAATLAFEPESAPGLWDALDELVGCAQPVAWDIGRNAFDLERYERHLRACTGAIPVRFDRIPVLAEDLRLDRIWRFIAMIFLLHDGLVDVCQQGETILVRQRGAD
jgi:uncharacterized protein (UPF0212 family)